MADLEQKFGNDISAGRIPPQAVDVERSVLGAMLIDREALPKALEVLDDSAFYNPTHQKYFKAMTALFEKAEPVDSVTLVEELRRRGQLNPTEDPVYIAQLTMNVSSSANVEYHARIVLEKALKRGLIAASTDVASRAYNETEDALDLLDDAETKIFQISERRLKKAATPIKRAITDTFEMLHEIHGQHGGVTGVPTGFSGLDDLSGGFQNSDLIIIAGRPSQGKTAFALSIARNSATDKQKPTPVLIFSIEMAEQQLAVRMLASEARVDAHKLRTGRLQDEDWSKLSRAAGKLTQTKIFIDDTPALGILELRAKARRLKAEHNIGLVIVDYLQLIQGPKSSESREREISMISRSLKALAKEIGIPVIALSQLNRAVEGRSDKRPMLSDLRESGAIEQDADVVMFVHRPETYGITEVKDEDGTPIPTEGIAEIIIGKQRNGPTGIVRLSFRKEYASFERLAHRALEGLAPPPMPTILPDNVVPF
jgi:replicative DNA helicase